MRNLNIVEQIEIQMVSGIGQFHTNEPDPGNPDKKLTPYSRISWAEIQALVDKPQKVNKAKARWIIPSIYPSRSFNTQEKHGQFPILWADLDDNQLNIDQLSWWLDNKFKHANYEIYNTSSATEENKKARILIPLKTPLSGTDWVLAQQVFNDLLEASEIKPDRATERPAQLCYLPNKPKQDSLYRHMAVRHELFFNPLHTWSNEITVKRDELATQQAEIIKAKQLATEKRATLRLSDAPNLISAFNLAYTPDEFLLAAGYAQKGNGFRHPNSQTGNYSASLLNGRVNALSSSDPMYSGGQGAHDAFSVFTVLAHGGDRDAALKDAGDNLLTIGCVSYNKAVQVEWAKKNKPALHVVKNDPKPASAAVESSNSECFEIPDAPDKAGQKPVFKFISANELMTRSISHDWQIKNLFEHGNIGQIFGATGSGKSFVALDMGYCIAAGLDYCGLPSKQGSVVYICGEGFGGLTRRLQALQGKYKADVSDKLFISEQPAAFMDIGVTSDVAEAIKSIGNVSLVIVDTYHRNMGGGAENSADDFGTVLRNIDTFLKPLGVTVLLVHHSGHGDTDRSRGSSAIRAAMDFEYKSVLSGNSITLTNTKMKDASTPDPLTFDFVQTDLGADDDGDAITSAYLDHKIGAATITSKSGKKLSARDDAILTCLDRAIAEHGVDPDSDIKQQFSGFNPVFNKDRKVARIDQWRELAYKTITVDGDKDIAQARKKAFKSTREKLANNKVIVVHGDYAWRLYDENPAKG